MKIILKKGAKYKVVYARSNGTVTSAGRCQRDIEFNHTELTQREWDGRVARRYTYKYPYPKIGVQEVESIEWIAGDDTEIVTLTMT